MFSPSFACPFRILNVVTLISRSLAFAAGIARHPVADGTPHFRRGMRRKVDALVGASRRGESRMTVCLEAA
jgi:hypothetical protein